MKNISKTVSFVMIVVLLSFNIYKGEIKFNNQVVKASEIETTISQPESSSEEMSSEELSSNEPSSSESPSDETTTEEPTSDEIPSEPETTTPDFVIIDELYKVRNGELIEYLGGKKDKAVKEIEIPAEITKIGDYVFDGCIYITKVKFEIDSQIKELGRFSFRKCKSLTEVNLPEGIYDLGYRAFAQCGQLKKLNIPKTVTKGRQLVGKEGAITYICFKKGTTLIPNEILRYANTLEEVKMYSDVRTIGDRAFALCSNLKTITLPDSIETIGTASFDKCISIGKLALPSQLEVIGDYAFRGCTSLLKLKIKKSVKSIGKSVFVDNHNLTLQLYANSVGKRYALDNKLKWEYTASEIKRQKKSLKIKETFDKQISQYDKKKYKLKKLKDYVPQGTCIIKNYLIVSMYHKNFDKKSMLLIYDKKSGKYLKKVYVPAIDHLGSITNVKDRLVIGLNNISATDYVAVVSYARLKKIKSGKTIKYNYTVKLPGYADFAAFDGTYYWAGRSANISYASMYGYKVKDKKNKLTFTKKYSYTVPANSQGMVVKKGKGGQREFVITQSYGVIANSSIYTYNINITENTSLGKPTSVKLAPSMIEGIVADESYLYVVFESAAGKYCSDDNYTTEIQMKKVTRIKYSNLKYLYEE